MPPTRLVLLDLDGTLVGSRGVGRRALEMAFSSLYGWSKATAGLSFGGLTDPVILRSVFLSHGETAARAEAERTRIMSAYLSALDEVLAGEHGAVWALPGAEDFVDALVADPRCVVGVLTGNAEGSALRKLHAAGLGDEFYSVGVFGDEAPTRNDLLPVALTRANAARRVPLGAPDVVVVGDTPKDVGVARAHGARAVGISTGATPHDELAASEPDALLASLVPLERALAAVLGQEPPPRANRT